MSGHIPENLIDEIRDRADLVEIIGSYIPLKRRGTDYWALCPFHREKTPSFKISAERQTFYCFGCKKSGNVFHFIQAQENVDFVGAVRLLAQRLGVRIPDPEPVRRSGTASGHGGDSERGYAKDKLYTLLLQVADWYQLQLEQEQGAAARAYLRERQLAADTAAQFKLGFAPDSWDAVLRWGERHGFGRDLMVAAGLAIVREADPSGGAYDRFRNRLLFPIWDELGRVVGFSGRALDADAKSAKYINTPETPVFHKSRLLYGLHLARQAFRDAGGALVCEGQLDVIACHRAGLTHAVSPQGTAFTEEHARMLKRFASAVTFAFDADTAGEKAAVRSLEIAHAAGLKANVVVLPEGEDPDSLSRAAGAEALAEVMSAVHPAFPFALSLARRHHDMESADGKARAVGEVLDLISTVPDPVQRAAHCQWLSTELRLPESALFDALNRALRGRRRRGGRREPGVAPPETPRAVQDRASTNSSLVERATLALLDLALHFGFIAHELIELLPPDELSETPASRALNLVMAHTEQGEWSLAARELAADQGLAGEPEIARLLVESDFAHLDPGRFPDQDRETLEIRLRQAMADCLEKFEQASIDERLPRLQRKWLAETDPECQRELGRAVSELAKRRDLLRRSRRSRTRQ